MKCNVGGIDRTGRIVLGTALLIIGLVVPMEMAWRILTLGVAAVALATAILRFCPANWVFGIDSCKGEQDE